MITLVIGGADGMVAGALTRLPGVVAVGRPQVDLALTETLGRCIDAHRPTAIICVGAYVQVDRAETEPDLAFRTNAEGPSELARLCAARDVPLVLASTDYVFDGAKSGAYVETDAPNPLNAYGRSKLAGEQAVAGAGGRAIVLRSSRIFAPRGVNFVRTMLQLARNRDEVRVVDDQIGLPTSATSFAAALGTVAAALRDHPQAKGGLYHAAGRGGPCSWAEFATLLFDISRKHGGPHARVVPVSSEDFGAPALRPKNSVLDCTKLERDFDLRLGDWRDSLEACIAAIAAAGWRLD